MRLTLFVYDYYYIMNDRNVITRFAALVCSVSVKRARLLREKRGFEVMLPKGGFHNYNKARFKTRRADGITFESSWVKFESLSLKISKNKTPLNPDNQFELNPKPIE